MLFPGIKNPPQPWKLSKRLKFDRSTKYYVYKPESVQENVTHEILWDFVIQMPPLFSVRRVDLVLINKKVLAILWILLFRRITE